MAKSDQREQIEQLHRRIRVALNYLERLSADSIWAHRASGLRGSLWRAEQSPPEVWQDDGFIAAVEGLLEMAFLMLKAAAMEIPDPESFYRPRLR